MWVWTLRHLTTNSWEKRAYFGTILRTGRRDNTPDINMMDDKLIAYWLLAGVNHLSQCFCMQIKKKSIEKAKQEERMSKDFAAMEEAALKAYEEDLKRMDRESKGNDMACKSWAARDEILRLDNIEKKCFRVRIELSSPSIKTAKSTATTSGETSGETSSQTSGETSGQETEEERRENKQDVQTADRNAGLGGGPLRRWTHLLLQHSNWRWGNLTSQLLTYLNRLIIW